jgi:uncharacterized membrane-anchored protein YjiN (DUF445 family)
MLRRHRARATGLRVAMGGVFVATELVPNPGFWVRLLGAGSEAAMIGGLADWFAVTALFRHPLGIPIPHTAIIPKNKDRIGEGLGAFVSQNFLTPEVLMPKLRAIDVAGRIAALCADAANAEAIARRVVQAVPYLVNSLEDREIRDFIARSLREQIASVNLAPLLGKALAVVKESGHHRQMFDSGVRLLLRLLTENEQQIYELVGERSRWWMPKTIDRAIAKAIISGVKDLLSELSRPDHPARERFDHAVAELIEKLQNSPEYGARIAALRDQLMQHVAAQHYVDTIWDEVRDVLLRDAASPSSTMRQALGTAIVSFGRTLQADASVRSRVNRRVELFARKVILPWRAEIGRFISDVVRGWEAQTVTERMELAVGRDLQYIRINGTLMGALIGCALFLISYFVF